jgi:Succinate dehydrogenase/fumarate reductase, flavoprotein subunit
VEIAKRSNVKFIEWTVVTSLDLIKEKISGVSAVDWRTGKPLSLKADAVIIATGGGGQIYRRSDNPARMTGDGYSLAKRAGLELIDMEFVQFYPIRLGGAWVARMAGRHGSCGSCQDHRRSRR